MNILLFTPAIKLSAIGRMSRLVAGALISLGHQVVIVRSEKPSLLQTPTHDFSVEIVRWDDLERMNTAIAWAESVVYQVGNHYDFHQGCLEWMERQAGVVCLHDFYLGHLFYGWAETRRQQAHSRLATWYGEAKAHEFFAHQGSESFLMGTAESTPMTEWICAMAHAVVTHSNWGVERILHSCPGPVRVVPLAYDKPVAKTAGAAPSSSPGEKFTVLTVGHVNPNKRVESVIRAIGSSALLSEQVAYVLVGRIHADTERELRTLAEKLGVELTIEGEVDELSLDEAIKTADVISCLRWPSLEAASASAIEAMLYGKPIIVTDVGFYAELPDDSVRKISHANELQTLQETLEELYKDSEARNSLGRRAQEWSSQTFTALNYARELVQVIQSAAAAGPVLAACQDFVSVLHTWKASTEIIDSVSLASTLALFE